MQWHAQAHQDQLVVALTRSKKGGVWLELGGNNPVDISNTYALEKGLGWTGTTIEYDVRWLWHYRKLRPGMKPIMGDATKVDYRSIDLPKVVDYLQIDLEEYNGSTMAALKLIEDQLMDHVTFSVVTFEHDIYCSNRFDTRLRSRTVFAEHRYIPIFQDVCHVVGDEWRTFEDWYAHPSGFKVEDRETLERMVATESECHCKISSQRCMEILGKYGFAT